MFYSLATDVENHSSNRALAGNQGPFLDHAHEKASDFTYPHRK